MEAIAAFLSSKSYFSSKTTEVRVYTDIFKICHKTGLLRLPFFKPVHLKKVLDKH